MTNPIKLVRLWWHMHRVEGGIKQGEVEQVVDAFVRAGIIKEAERKDAVSVFAQQRAARICGEIADSLTRGSR